MITSKQRSFLKGLGHNLSPVVFIGKNDLTENVLKEIDVALENKELIKIKIQDGSVLTAKETASKVAELMKAEFVQAIGKKFTIYRKSEENPEIVLPRK